MTITYVKVWKEDLDLTKPYTIAYKTISAVENVFLLLETNNGLRGIGVAAPAAFVTGETVSDSLHALQTHAESLLLGKDIRDYQSLLRNSLNAMPAQPAARAAIDIALYDLVAQSLGVPLARYLGQMYDGLPTSVTIGIKDEAATVAEGLQYVADGFYVIKLKTGRTDVEEDIAVFRKLREAVGPHVVIRVDANQGYTPSALEAFSKACDPLDVEFYEQPLPQRQSAQMLEVPESLRRRCAADEDLITPTDALHLAHPPQPFGIFNIKLMKCGGVGQALEIARIAQLSGISLMWGCNDESIVSITAALHAALACPATRYLDLDGSFDLARDAVFGGFVLRNGCLYPSDKPGLGVDLFAGYLA